MGNLSYRFPHYEILERRTISSIPFLRGGLFIFRLRSTSLSTLSGALGSSAPFLSGLLSGLGFTFTSLGLRLLRFSGRFLLLSLLRFLFFKDFLDCLISLFCQSLFEIIRLFLSQVIATLHILD